MNRSVLRCLTTIALVIAVAACGDVLPPVAPPSDFDFVLSEPQPVDGPLPAVAAAASPRGEPVVYVSVPSGGLPGGRRATIRNLANGFITSTAVADGGFDPVGLPGVEDDTVEVDVDDSTGATHRAWLTVPLRRAPVVVRTVPPRHGTDVPLNAHIVVVFSEPMDPRTITTGMVGVLRGGIALAGRVTLTNGGLYAELVPDSLLDLGTEYTLVVEAGVADRTGDVLGDQVTVSFSTTTRGVPTDPIGSVTVVPDTATVTLGGFLQLVASVRDSQGVTQPGAAVTWTSNDVSIATVSASGLVSTRGVGLVTIVAAAGRAAGSARVSVVTPDVPPPGGDFTPTGTMTTPRAGHTATLLGNGKVLIAGAP